MIKFKRMNTLKVGDKIPSFECFDDKENLIKSENFKGHKLIVFFYPRANTPGCTCLLYTSDAADED